MNTPKTTALLATIAIASVASAQSVRLFTSDWDTNSVYEFHTVTGALVRTVLPARADGANAMAGMAIGADGALYLTDFATDAVRRYNLDTGALLSTFVAASSGGLDNCTDLTFGPDGQLYAANGDTGGVLKFNGATGQFVNTLIPPSACAASRFMLFDGGIVYVTDHFANSVKKFDATTGTLLLEFECCAPEGRGLALTPWGELLVASFSNRSIERFNVVSGTHIGTLVSDIHCNGMKMGPDGFLYVGEAARHRIERFDAHTGQRNLLCGEGILRDPWQLAFAPAAHCRADFNNDNVVDFFDYLDFVSAFSSLDPSADFNGDSIIDFFDYLDFVDAFAAGC